MIDFKFTDLSGEIYSIIFGWSKNKCTIITYPKKWDSQGIAMCSFDFDDELIIDNADWANEFLSPETKNHINRLIRNKAFW